MPDESLPEPVERSSATTALTFRPQDKLLYGSIGVYLLMVIVVMGVSHGSGFIRGGMIFGLFVPVLLLIFLIAIQITRRPRFSPVAFAVSVLAVLLSGYIALVLAGEASAAV